MASPVAPIRVTLQQPALPDYRIPVFRELAARPGIELLVAYGDGDVPNLANAQPEGFRAEFAPMRRFRVRGHELFWHSPQFRYATRATTDVLILSWNLHHLTLFPALLRARAAGVRTILWGHGYSKQESSWRASLRHRATRLADATLFYSHAAARSHILRGLSPDRVFVALNALDQGPIQQARGKWLKSPELLAEFQHEQGLAEHPVILFVSRLDPSNRVGLLLEAVAALRDMPRPPRVVIIGKGPEEAALRSRATALGIADRVIFAGAIYDQERIAPWFLSSKVFCYPANAGLSLLHAFGYGLPVVTSGKLESQNPEVEAVLANYNGLLYRDGDAADLAANLRRLLLDSDLCTRLAANAHQTAVDRFDLPNMVDGIEAAIRFVMGPRPARQRSEPPIASPAGPATHESGVDCGSAVTGMPPDAQIVRGSRPFPRPLRLAIIANANTPYRQHQHLRIAREMPEVELWSLFTHDTSNAPWTIHAAPEIRPILFGSGEDSAQQGKAHGVPHEWAKGGEVIGWLRDHAIDVVILLGYNDAGRGRIINWCYQHKVPVFLWGDSNVRGDRARGYRLKLKRAVLKGLLGRCTGVLTCGRLGDEYFARYGVPREKIHRFTLEPDYSLIENLPQSIVDEVAGKYGIDRGRRRIIYSGRLAQEKRVDLLIRAFAGVAEQRPDWDLLIVGNGPMRSQLGHLVPETLRSRVIWPGFLGDQHYVSALYKLSDVLVLPSDYEPWALVINEAAAAGLAIIASDVVGAAAELVQEGVNGHTFPAGDLESLIRNLEDATNPANTARMKAASRDILAQWRRDADPISTLRACLPLRS
jgi:glycosyltransferase involved in cell wall biosynthesis